MISIAGEKGLVGHRGYKAAAAIAGFVFHGDVHPIRVFYAIVIFNG
jgi:hypothetical protein